MTRYVLLLFVGALWVVPVSSLENAYYGDDFLNLGFGARTSAMAGASLGCEGDVAALYYNPAGLCGVKRRMIMVMHASQFAGQAQYDLFGTSLELRPGLGLGAGCIRSEVDGIQDTRKLELDETGTPIYDRSRISYLSAVDHIFLVGLGRQLKRGLGIGGTVKVFYRKLGDLPGYGLGFDLGSTWRIGKAFSAGLSIENVTTSYMTWNSGTNETTYPSARAGISYYLPVPYFYGDLFLQYELGEFFSYSGVNSKELQAPSFSSITDDPLGRFLSGTFGAEYRFREILAIRGGLNAVYLFTAGAGLVVELETLKAAGLQALMERFGLRRIGLDYAYQHHAELRGSQLVSINVQL